MSRVAKDLGSWAMSLHRYVGGKDELLTAGVNAYFLAAAPTPDKAMRRYSATLRILTDAERFPSLHRVLDAGVFDRADAPDDEFAFGLEQIMAGIEALVRARAAD